MSKVFYFSCSSDNFCMENGENEKSVQVLFGQNVKKYRKQSGLTQEQLAEKLGISQKHLSIIETGTQFASASLIGKISEVLGVSVADLFGGSNDDIKKEIESSRDVLLSAILNEMNQKFALLSAEIHKIKNSVLNLRQNSSTELSFL